MPDDSLEPEALVAALEALADDRTPLARWSEAHRRRLLIAAGQLSRPTREQARALAKAHRRNRRDALRAEDEARLNETGIRQLRALPVFRTPPPALPAPREPSEPGEPGEPGEHHSHHDRDAHHPHPEPSPDEPRLRQPRVCYVCKQSYERLHAFYDQLCPGCGDFNFGKRSPRGDLRGRTALVTGARVKIGYQASVMLLRAGARVLVTTRFPRDAAARYAREVDFARFASRLVIHGLDLRHTPSVELFAQHVLRTEPRLDFVIHNACQTVRRPSGFYAHLLEHERAALRDDPALAPLLEAHDALKAQHALARFGAGDPAAGLTDAPGLSQLALLEEDTLRGGGIFPEGMLDQDLQQIDRRQQNSWRMRLHEVPTVELLEVQLVNAVAPFVLNGRLRGLMSRTPGEKHIVNVSAVEGQFYREHKTDKHPHTNMAKAALNMMTRTSAEDYARDGIHMNAVDTGWVTDEDPAHLSDRKRAVHGFHPPLDIVDGAARIVDPIFDGLATGTHVHGLFLKDYKPVPW